ncbi:MAG: 50S ribosomal protein L24 [Propionibacteriaceae bacterium]|nr:50S ribosomal protein L24 [Propionibacteriaceae bacterium]
MAMHVKKGDRVRVIAGKDKGVVGDIIGVNPAEETVTVAGVNIVKRHRKDRSDGTGRQVIKGGIMSSEAPIHASNVALVVRQGTKEVVTRVGFKRVESTRKRPDGTEYTVTRSVRIAKKTGKEI